jgi:hypothetical protein
MPAQNGSGSWVSYTGAAGIVLAVVLALAAAAVAYAGFRLPRPVRPPRPGPVARVVIVALWVLALVALVAGVKAYLGEVASDGLTHTPAKDPITPVTLTGVFLLFWVIAFLQKPKGALVAWGSAVLGAMAAPFIFELPFDLIIMARTHPLIDPDLYRVLLFGALIGVDVMTLVLLWLSPAVRLHRATLWCLAGMLALFAGWALFGFGYPATAGPITMNVLSKIMGLVTALTLFTDRRPRAADPPVLRAMAGAAPHAG